MAPPLGGALAWEHCEHWGTVHAWKLACAADAFYASVEERDNPALRGVPMAVGGLGMCATANYEVRSACMGRFHIFPCRFPQLPHARMQARKYGVRAAMPGFIARKLCPQLVFVEPHFDK
jgi:DNA polymerase kappa